MKSQEKSICTSTSREDTLRINIEEHDRIVARLTQERNQLREENEALNRRFEGLGIKPIDQNTSPVNIETVVGKKATGAATITIITATVATNNKATADNTGKLFRGGQEEPGRSERITHNRQLHEAR